MRPLQRRLLLGLTIATISLPAVAPASAESIMLKVGISEPVNTVLAIWMADTAGFYEADGIKVEIINMNGGSRGAAELAAGRIDAMHVGLSSVARLNRTGGDLRIIASLANVIRFTFFSGSGVKTAADLKGGVVGVSSFGSESDSTVTLALKRLGLSRDDVTLKEYGASTRRLAAVKSGEIKATAVNEPFSSMAREQGLNVLFDLVPEQIPWLFTAIVVRRDAIAGRRDLLTRFIRATAEGNYLALSDANKAKAVLARQAGITDPKILDISYNDFKLLSPQDIEPSQAAAKNILAQFPDASQKVEDHVDGSILDALRKDGVFTALAQKYKR
ncbi:MAG: NitT/TauT family transport system substrate-binding protein [Alphaproteobacteria bacterium]|jgi:ABC-type nitrate/sulfonate/bicarbonate transport system substrate-binding protein|nr:NitT/TauT family transport system substrate-binding protein [Alphaproteobacteria bacterium]